MFSAFKADGTVKEPKTPSSPTEASDYLDLDDIKKAHSYTNLNPNSWISVPLPPPPPPPGMCIPFEYMNITPSGASTPLTPPVTTGKVIEFKLSKYSPPEANLKPSSNETEDLKEKNSDNSDKIADLKIPNEGVTISESQKVKEDSLNLETLKHSGMEIESQENGIIKKENENEKENFKKEISGDVVDGAHSVDVTDSSVHDYMNLGPSSEDIQIVGVIPKKLAPPVPPRCQYTFFSRR